jgi:hypothetical protein
MAQRTPTSDCDTRIRLESALDAACRLFSSATGELAKNLARLSDDDRLRLRIQSEQALVEVANARILLEEHRHKHGC